jgi:adenylate cyclase
MFTEIYIEALLVDEELADAHCARGLALAELSRGKEAREEFETALQLDRDCYEAFHYYGRHCFAHQEYERDETQIYRFACPA